MTVSNLLSIIKETFNESNLKSFTDVYEKYEDGYKYVVSFHELQMSDEVVIHTKFIFYLDEDKKNLNRDYFLYLYDINCIYKRVNIPTDLKEKLVSIIETNTFGDKLLSLSKFISDSPTTYINKIFSDNDVRNITLYSVLYNPKYKIVPCENLDFSFDIIVNGSYQMKLTIKLIDDTFKLTYVLLNNTYEYESDDITDVANIIAFNIIDIFNNKM